MLRMDKSLQELQGMLRVADGNMKKSFFILMSQGGGKRIKKMKRKATPKVTLKYKGKGKMVPNQNTLKVKSSSTSDYFYCQSKDHWKRNSPKYLEVMMTETLESLRAVRKATLKSNSKSYKSRILTGHKQSLRAARHCAKLG
jgi:hypothetical protein